MTNMQFHYDWCSYHFKSWLKLIKKYNPDSVLEIGSFEGRSACFWNEYVKTVHCVDTWTGSDEHKDIDFMEIERRFDQNIVGTGIIKYKGNSSHILPQMITDNRVFDLIYIDGSHRKEQVLSDAVLSFHLCKAGSIIIFDDYLWYDSFRFDDWKMNKPDSISSYPKPAIDAFVNIFDSRLKTIDVSTQYIVEVLP